MIAMQPRDCVYPGRWIDEQSNRTPLSDSTVASRSGIGRYHDVNSRQMPRCLGETNADANGV